MTTQEKADKWRANYVPAPHFYNLNQACALINKAFPEGMCYLVGSSLERRDYRDVDVRMMLPDEEYDRIFGSGDWTNPYWSLLCTSLSLWLKQQTDLPIDFQIQRRTQANEAHDGQRAALGIFLDYPGERPSDLNRAIATPAPVAVPATKPKRCPLCDREAACISACPLKSMRKPAHPVIAPDPVKAAYAECARIARERAILIQEYYNHESGPEKTANLIADEIESAALRAGKP